MLKKLSFSLLLATSSSVSAKDFGIQGHVHSTVEQPFTQMMQERAAQVNTAQLEQQMQDKARERINSPVPVSDLSKTQEGRLFWHDPSYIVPEDIVLPCGRLLHEAGSRVNPLDHENLERRLIFLDSRDQQQVSWLEQELKTQYELETIVILVGGSPLQLQKELGRKVYFDQNGELTSRFGIKHVPARLEQDGKMLKIEEIKLG